MQLDFFNWIIKFDWWNEGVNKKWTKKRLPSMLKYEIISVNPLPNSFNSLMREINITQ